MVKKIAKLFMSIVLVSALIISGSVSMMGNTWATWDDHELVYRKTFGGSKGDVYYSVAGTSDGGFVAAGTSMSKDGDLLGLNYNSYDAIIVKYNKDGEVAWAKNFGGTGLDYFYSVIQTKDGGYVAVGESSSSNYDLTGLYKGGSALIVKFNDVGGVEWAKTFGGSGSDAYFSVAQVEDGGLVAAGTATSGSLDMAGIFKGNYDGIIIKYDIDGNEEWKSVFGGSSTDEFYGVVASGDGGVVAVGTAASSDKDLSGLNKGNYDGLIVKYNNSGGVEWKNTFGGTSAEIFYGVEAVEGGYVAVGRASSNDQDMAGLYKGSSDAVTVKFDAAGEIKWAKSFGGNNQDAFHSVVQADDGGYIVAGRSHSSNGDMAGITPGPVIVKYGKSGEIENVEPLVGVGFGFFEHDYRMSVASTTDKGYVVVGGYRFLAGYETRTTYCRYDPWEENEEWVMVWMGELMDEITSQEEIIIAALGWSDIWYPEAWWSEILNEYFGRLADEVEGLGNFWGVYNEYLSRFQSMGVDIDENEGYVAYLLETIVFLYENYYSQMRDINDCKYPETWEQAVYDMDAAVVKYRKIPGSGDGDEDNISSHWKDGRNKYKKGDKTLTFIIDYECSLLDEVIIDNKVLVQDKDYTVSCIDDKLNITLTPEYLNTLDPDTNYPITVTFTDGEEVEDIFTVTDTRRITPPNTGILQIGGISILGLLIVLGLGVLVRKRAKVTAA